MMFKYSDTKNYSKGFTPPLKREYLKKVDGVNPFSRAGFTLMEVLIAMSIFSGILLTVSIFGLDLYDFTIFIGENLSAQQEIQATLQVMTVDMKMMNQSVLGSYAIESTSQNALTFYSDIDGDGLTDRVRYFLEGNILKKGIIKPGGSPMNYSGTEKITEMVHNIYTPSGNIFAYYNSSYTGNEAALTFPINISVVRLIKVNITVDQSPADAASRINLSASVNIRNL